MRHAATIGFSVLATPLFLASLASPAVEPIAYAFVTADVVNVRNSPQPGAPVVAKLRINTQVEVLAEQNGFSRIRLNLPAGNVEGYISKGALGPDQLTFDEVRKRATELANTPEHRLEARAWAERAVALDGSSDEALQALAALLDDQTSTKARARIRDILEGKASAWIALCRENREGAFPRASRYRVEVLFRLDAGARVDPAFESKEGASPAAAKARISELSGAQWFVLDAHGPRQVGGSPFALAREVEEWNESPEGAPPSDLGGGAGGRLILGPCSQPGAVYSTQPLRALTPTLGSSDFSRAVTALAPMALISNEVPRGQIESVEGRTFEGVSEMRLGLGGDREGDEICPAARIEAHAWGVVTPSGKVLAQLGILHAYEVIDATDTARFQLKRGDGARIFIGLARSNNCAKGINYLGQVLVLPAKGEPVKLELNLGGEGC